MNINKEAYYLAFDKLFENYADKYYTAHSAEYGSPDEFAKDLDKVYHVWATTAQDAIGGLSPSEFFNRIPTEELIDILKGSCTGDRNPSSLLFDRMATEPELIDGLVKLARSSDDEKLLTVAVSIINELGTADSEFYLHMLERTDIDMCVKELCLSEVCTRATELESELIERAEAADDLGLLEVFAEALSYCATGNERIIAIMRKLLSVDPNTAYVAELIGRYGDESLAADLYALLDTCDYVSFMEIRNAIEELGGTVDENYRDFSDDPFYQVIKADNNR